MKLKVISCSLVAAAIVISAVLFPVIVNAQQAPVRELKHFRINGAEALGQVTKPDKAAGTFTIQPLVKWRGFTPTGDSVDVATNSATQFYGRSGNRMSASDWFDYVILNLSPSTAALAKGKYSNGTITAKQVRLQ